MIVNDAEVLESFTKAMDGEILLAIDPAFDTAFARKALVQRTIGADKDSDEVATRDRTGKGAVIGDKTVSNVASGSSVTSTIFPMKKIVDGFNASVKDLKLDPKLQTRNILISTTNVARKEDQVTLYGNAAHNITGLVATAQANPNGKITAAGAAGNDVNNIGAWDGSDATLDPYSDLLEAVARVSNRFVPYGIGGRRTDLLAMWKLDSERQPFINDIAVLFGKGDPKAQNPWGDWVLATDIFTAGKVYVFAKDAQAGELVISENPHSKVYAEQPGEVVPVEVIEYIYPEFHNTQGYVEVDVA